MDRRDFIKTVIVGGAVLSLDTAFTAHHLEAGTQSLNTIGECKRLSIKCISEVGWWDNKVLLADLMKAGGPKEADQWTSEWTPTNAAGSCSLVEVESLDGSIEEIPRGYRVGREVCGRTLQG